MIVTAALCWWNEEPALLRECIAGIANVADRVVAVDGAFRRYPGATIRSSDDQAATIAEASAAHGLDCLILQAHRLWAGQVEKRAYMLAAAVVASDWVVMVDADHIIKAERAGIRHELGRTMADVLDVPLVTPINPDVSLDDAPSRWHQEQTAGRIWHPLIVRALPGLRVETHHWWMSAIKGKSRVWVWPTDDDRYPTLLSERITSVYEVEHRCMFRSRAQRMAERAYENDRELVVLPANGHEDDAVGLPEPNYDYERMPR